MPVNEVLTQIAAEAGLSATDFSRFVESDKGLEKVLKEEAERKQRGLNGVPFFVINGVPAFSGAQHPETLSPRFVRFSTWMRQSAHSGFSETTYCSGSLLHLRNDFGSWTFL
jgi:protein-disulfide isomerase-like protein with CxxC motif